MNEVRNEEHTKVISEDPKKGTQVIEIDLDKYLAASTQVYTEEQKTEIKEIICNVINDAIARRKQHQFKDVAELFNGLLSGHITEIQNFSDKTCGRRLYSENVGTETEPVWQTFARNKNGTVEPWTITKQNLQKGLWIEIPLPVSFGIAYDALMRGDCDYIRCEDWSDMTMYLRNSNKKRDSLPPGFLITVNDNTKLSLSATSMNSMNWIMIKLPKK